MSWGVCRRAVILTVLASGLIAGCSAKATHDIDGPRSPNLLFSNDRSALVATQIGRSEWPATLGNVESTQETVFLEYYYDYQGHESLERNNPQRFFRSYRIGMQAR